MDTLRAARHEVLDSIKTIMDSEIVRAIMKIEHPGLVPSTEETRKHSHTRVIPNDSNMTIKHYWRNYVVLTAIVTVASTSNGLDHLQIVRHLEKNRTVYYTLDKQSCDQSMPNCQMIAAE